MENNMRVRKALAKAREIAARQGGRIPKLDAIIAVLNADNIDRSTGITNEHEVTPGRGLAYRIIR